MIVIDLRKYKTLDLSFYLALEEYLTTVDLVSDYFFLWDIDKSIIVGHNQLIEAEVNLDFVKKYDFKVYRRLSGGGAIFADKGDFMFSFITTLKSKDEIFNEYLNKIKDVLLDLGVETKLSGRNDLLYNDKKFSGSAIYYKNNKSIIHGTFLYDSDLDLLDKFLTPNIDKLTSHGVKSVRERVINLKNYLNLKTKEEVMDYFLYHIDKDIEIIELNDDELEEVYKLKEKFDSDDYTYKKEPPFTYHSKERFEKLEIEVFIDIVKGVIKDFRLIGDFFKKQDLDNLYLKYLNKNYDDIIDITKNININEYIFDLTNEDFLKLFRR